MSHRSTRHLLRPGLLVLLVVLFVLPGCTSEIPQIEPGSPALQGLSPVETAELRRGRGEYILKCSGCHALYPPATGGPGYWRMWMEKMVEPARLAPDERRRIELYLLRFCRPEEAKPTFGARLGSGLLPTAPRRSSLPPGSSIQ